MKKNLQLNQFEPFNFNGPEKCLRTGKTREMTGIISWTEYENIAWLIIQVKWTPLIVGSSTLGAFQGMLDFRANI